MRKLLIISFALLIPINANAQEPQITLTVPITYTAPSPKTNFKLERYSIELVPTPKIIIRLVGDGEDYLYPCVPNLPPLPASPASCINRSTPAQVQTMINALFTFNLQNRHFLRLLYDRLIADYPLRFVGGATVQ